MHTQFCRQNCPNYPGNYFHDQSVNRIGRERAKLDKWQSAQDACADFRARNNDLPKEFW